MNKNNLKVSVITVCRNEMDTIEQTIASVIQQDYCNVEHIIIDGKSTDGTVGIIERYKDKIAILVSEQDCGIYDAMNKGLGLAQGDIIIFLNANDTFFDPNVLSRVAGFFNESDKDIIYGNAMMTGKHKNSNHVVKYDEINKWFLLGDTICHQAVFARKKLYDNIGGFDLQFKIAADYEWLLRAVVKYRAKISHLDMVICNYSLDGMSNDRNLRLVTLEEYNKIASMYFGQFLTLIKRIHNYLLSIVYKVYSIFRKK